MKLTKETAKQMDKMLQTIIEQDKEIEQLKMENKELKAKLNSINDIAKERSYYFDKFYFSEYGYEKNEEMEKTNVALTHICLICP
tara:strand:- start:342 stop:596 length:255 start_codon:yes stop_codon:yes gene_type:complete